MNPIKLAITPVPKPRMTQSDRWRSRPCTERYWQYKEELNRLWGDRELPDTFHVIFTMPMPAGWTQKRKALFDGKPHQQKPDCDNLGKHLWMRYQPMIVTSMMLGLPNDGDAKGEGRSR